MAELYKAQGCILPNSQCWEFPQAHQSKADNFGEDQVFLLIFLQFYVCDLRFKPGGPTTFLTEFQTLQTVVD